MNHKGAIPIGLLDLAGAGLYGYLFFGLVPSRHGGFSLLAAVVCAGLALGGIGMLSRKRAGFIIGAVGSALLLLSGLFIILGLATSAAYLSGIYGGFGRGSAVVLVVLCLLVFIVICLLPALQLRWVLKRVRRGTGGKGLTMVALLLVFGGSMWAARGFAGLTPTAGYDIEAAEYTVDALRQRLETGDWPPEEALEAPNTLTFRGPRVIFASLYRDGRRGETYVGEGSSGLEALEALGDALAEGESELGEARFRIDFLTAAGPVLDSIPLMVALSIVPGIDGVGYQTETERSWILGHELLEEGLLTAFKPFPWMDLRFGVDRDDLRSRLRLGFVAPQAEGRLFRFRSQSFIEDRSGVIHALFRNGPERPPVTRETVDHAIELAAEWVLAAQRSDGRFRYLYEPFRDEFIDSGYSYPRHAGTAGFLLQVYDYTGDERYLVAADAALDWLWEQTRSPCGSTSSACVAGRSDQAVLGSSALATAAFAHRALLGDSQALDRARLLGTYLLNMQRANGDFFHRFYFDGGIDRDYHSFYYTGEAAFALSRLALADPEEPVWRDSVRMTMEFWVGDYWDHFAGGFFFAEEHWTCLAIEAAHELFNEDRYDQFCFDIADFLARLVLEQDDTPYPDFIGGTGFGPIFPPHTTPTATRAEAMVAAYRISVSRGEPNVELGETLLSMYGFILGGQYTEAHAALLPNPQRALGGIRENLFIPTVRIDYNQHAGSALLRGVDLLLPHL
jgi:hypothetical protein